MYKKKQHVNERSLLFSFRGKKKKKKILLKRKKNKNEKLSPTMCLFVK